MLQSKPGLPVLNGAIQYCAKIKYTLHRDYHFCIIFLQISDRKYMFDGGKEGRTTGFNRFYNCQTRVRVFGKSLTHPTRDGG